MRGTLLFQEHKFIKQTAYIIMHCSSNNKLIFRKCQDNILKTTRSRYNESIKINKFPNNNSKSETCIFIFTIYEIHRYYCS